MKWRRLIPMLLVAVAAATGAAAVIEGTTSNSDGPTSPRSTVSAAPSVRLGPVNVAPYVAAIRAADAAGLRVWLEADLVRRWLAGPAAFQQAIAALTTEARERGVVGIKIADELGYNDGLTSAAKVESFLDASAAAIRRAAPGKLILIDMVIPALGCLPDAGTAPAQAEGCRNRADSRYKQLSLDQVGRYLDRHDIDVLDLSSALLDQTNYATWGVSIDQAQTAAWDEVARRGWATKVTLQSRKALAHPGDDTTDSASADAELHTFVDVPTAAGAVATDIWTWRQFYQGQTYRILNPGLTPTPLWDGLVSRHKNGVRLFTHLSPSSVEVSLAADLAKLADAFTDVFIASGTG